MATPVEIDIYNNVDSSRVVPVYMGIDIGSTSTKAAIVDINGSVVAGLYTRTAGRPVEAVQAILKQLMIQVFHLNSLG